MKLLITLLFISQVHADTLKDCYNDLFAMALSSYTIHQSEALTTKKKDLSKFKKLFMACDKTGEAVAALKKYCEGSDEFHVCSYQGKVKKKLMRFIDFLEPKVVKNLEVALMSPDESSNNIKDYINFVELKLLGKLRNQIDTNAGNFVYLDDSMKTTPNWLEDHIEKTNWHFDEQQKDLFAAAHVMRDALHKDYAVNNKEICDHLQVKFLCHYFSPEPVYIKNISQPEIKPNR